MISNFNSRISPRIDILPGFVLMLPVESYEYEDQYAARPHKKQCPIEDELKV